MSSPAQTTPARVLDEILAHRRAVRQFAATPLPDEVVHRSVQRAMLAPSSGNMQFWEFYRVKTPAKKEVLAHLCLSQDAALNAAELMVVVVRKDLYRQRARRVLEETLQLAPDPQAAYLQKARLRYGKTYPMYYFMDPLGIKGIFTRLFLRLKRLTRPGVLTGSACDLRVTAHKNVALAAQTFMLSIAAEGYDSCPMEGFDGPRIRRFLGLPRTAEISMVIALGKADPHAELPPRVRLSMEEVYREV
ncbi:MAG: nitroreductase family protein [Bacteroidetes bacterium]|nr:MAG: nitroreductase family protein [Bacteroidota bacterium]